MDADLNATVKQVLYSNADASWHVIEVEDDSGGICRATGSLNTAAAGMRLTATGRWDQHGGRAVLRVRDFRLYQPVSEAGIARFLASDAMPGVGVETAQSIVSCFGEAALEVIRKSPDRLKEVKGLGEQRARLIHSAVVESAEKIEAMSFLHERFGDARAEHVYQRYGADAPRLLGENPYRLMHEMEGIGFRTTDALGFSLGFRRNCHERLAAGVMHAMKEEEKAGNTAVAVARLMDLAIESLQVSAPDVGNAISRLCNDGGLVSYETGCRRFYASTSLARAEERIAGRFSEIMKRQSCIKHADLGEDLQHINKTGRGLTSRQIQAITMALTEKVCVITGGPGTGKTFVLDSIRSILHRNGVNVHLCAPTGLAARRMRDATGADAATIHRLLEFEPTTGGFLRHDRRPLPRGVVVVDEASMCDARLLSALSQAITSDSHLVLIGDSDQLPSVGPGCVLRDVIQSGVIRTVHLSHTFRQQAGSRIVSLAGVISTGRMPRLESGEGVSFLDERRGDAIVERVVEQVLSFTRNSNVGVHNDLQVITPRNRGPLSVREANVRLQRALNPSPRCSFVRNGYTFGIGDKVMQTVNDTERELSNGDIGRIQWVSDNGDQARVVMANGVVEYSSVQLRQLVLAYAVTAHKAQGSEFPVVILAIDRSSYTLFDRTLLYTAVTRAKTQLVVVGDGRAIRSAVKRDESLNRTTTLRSRLISMVRDGSRGDVADPG